MHTATIYHNPDCGTSRNTLALLRHLGIEPNIVHYLDNPPDESTLRGLIAQMGVSVREIIRTNVPPYQELQLDNPDLDDEALIMAMLAEPILINRPIVAGGLGVALCRPSEKVLSVVSVPLTVPFQKEDGEWIYPED
ncbi:arsenate reductase (glutaredoxin) [Neisseria animalis]|uniref:Arsenate reductase n=1 Tax=Neisseria animalis TaxID=492 RepID=A0A5P3MR56_NEIAN|nr:arsenate reductase (glutaredoxin) [Neisseria animalis]QEY23271.1 arsenate reductase (glutaredoxin) [Neisseria animalis]ROW31974.1 arsenate reductase (glutaredoxin) [Neisseria animalis]VEE08555.1 arsenate reductase [Neisseria animalis]